MEDEVVFYHYGILGMKWGRRRTPEELMRARGRLEKKYEKTERKVTKQDVKSSKYRLKAARLRKKALNSGFSLNADKILKYEIKSAKMDERIAKGRKRLSKLNQKINILDTELDSFSPEEIAAAKRIIYGYDDDDK